MPFALSMLEEGSGALCLVLMLRIKEPWIVGGNFNVVSNWNEKKGGRMLDDGSMLEFNSFIIQAGLNDISSSLSAFSWANNQFGCKRIYKKLDRVFINSEALLPGIQCSFLPRVHLDHMPVLVKVGNAEVKIGAFRFQRIWCYHEDFSEFVGDFYKAVGYSDDLINLHVKMKYLRSQLKI
uniref:Endonuclease/exonuclease/phosphatase domain-containing protein n=1 Tax=Kalanchoe fedtschenkoi TaxID=63787 RepID=A0A7N0U2D1_KALFE